MVKLFASRNSKSDSDTELEALFPLKALLHLGEHVARPSDTSPHQVLTDSSKHTSLYLGAVRVSVQYGSRVWSRLLIAVWGEETGMIER